jgi:hypothetical protein
MGGGARLEPGPSYQERPLLGTKIVPLQLVKFHVATEGQPVRPSWCQAPHWAHNQMFLVLFPCLLTHLQYLFVVVKSPL